MKIFSKIKNAKKDIAAKSLLLVLSGAMILGMSTANAYPKYKPNPYNSGNLWELKFYYDDSNAQVPGPTHRLCFSKYSTPAAGKTHLRGKWYSTTYPNWNGLYRQEGDSLRMFGNYAEGKGNDSAEIDMVSYRQGTLATGHWTEWRDTGMKSPFKTFTNVVLKRIGKCSFPEKGRLAEIAIPARLVKKTGAMAKSPLQKGLEPVKAFTQYESVKRYLPKLDYSPLR